MMETSDTANMNVTSPVNLNSPGHSSDQNTNNTSAAPRKPSAQDANNFFAVRQGALEKAIEECLPVILTNIDGQLKGTYLLTEIDHWDVEKEKLVFLCDRTVIILKYDFITLKIMEYKRMPLTQFDVVYIGELKYPQKSLAPRFSSGRNILGVRCQWNKGTPIKWLQNWNPWSKDIPWVTFASHPLIYHKDTTSQNYSIENFSDELAKAIENISQSHDSKIQVCYQPIIIENYVGLASYVHNAIEVGFYKSHGRVSF